MSLEERLAREREERLREWLETRESCVEDSGTSVHGLRVAPSDEVVIRLRGRNPIELRGKIRCYNPFWGTLILVTEESEIMIKVKDIVMIQKRAANHADTKPE